MWSRAPRDPHNNKGKTEHDNEEDRLRDGKHEHHILTPSNLNLGQAKVNII